MTNTGDAFRFLQKAICEATFIRRAPASPWILGGPAGLMTVKGRAHGEPLQAKRMSDTRRVIGPGKVPATGGMAVATSCGHSALTQSSTLLWGDSCDQCGVIVNFGTARDVARVGISVGALRDDSKRNEVTKAQAVFRRETARPPLNCHRGHCHVGKSLWHEARNTRTLYIVATRAHGERTTAPLPGPVLKGVRSLVRIVATQFATA